MATGTNWYTRPLAFAGGLLVLGCLITCDPVPAWQANDRLAVSTLCKLWRSEQLYYRKKLRYGLLFELGPQGAGLVERPLAEGREGAVRFEVRLTESGYDAFVFPETFSGAAGRRSFFFDQAGAVHEAWLHAASASSPVVSQLDGACPAVPQTRN